MSRSLLYGCIVAMSAALSGAAVFFATAPTATPSNEVEVPPAPPPPPGRFYAEHRADYLVIRKTDAAGRALWTGHAGIAQCLGHVGDVGESCDWPKRIEAAEAKKAAEAVPPQIARPEK